MSATHNLVPRAQPPAGDAAPPPAFHVMVKPRGSECNLACAYCFYLRKHALYAEGATFRMSDAVLEEFTRQYIAAHRAPEVNFAWQGGEPTLMGVDFFRRAVELQRKHAPAGVRVRNSFQTNGVLLDDDWCRFFERNRFLVGLSLDGPRELHDAYRRDRGGHPTFDRVERALRLLQRHGVEHNVLCVVNRENQDHAREVYAYYRSVGVEFAQFIPGVEMGPDGPAPWSVTPDGFGSFMCGVFDAWLARDVGRVFVQHFDAALAAFMGMEPTTCVHARQCGDCLAMEHDGSVFSCDHYVQPDNYLGNVMDAPLAGLLMSPFQRAFGRDKQEGLPAACRRCPVLFACNGGCPKDRLAPAPEGDGPLNYLCTGYRRFFTHIGPAMRRMASLVKQGRPAAEAMARARPAGEAGRNDPCPCGSGLKFKRCCLGR